MKIRLTPASWGDILRYSCGEVKSPRLSSFKYKNPKPYAGGLLCESIFGPVKSYMCSCGTVQGIANLGKKCTNCKVTCLDRSARRDRWGHFPLWYPVPNPVYLPILAGLLNVDGAALDGVLRMTHSIFLEHATAATPGALSIEGSFYIVKIAELGEDVTYSEYVKQANEYVSPLSLSEILRKVNLRFTTNNDTAQKLLENNIVLSSLLIKYLPISPAGYRDIIITEEFPSHNPLNVLYMNIINKCLRARNLLDFKAPRLIMEYESAVLYKAVHSLVYGIREFNREYLTGIMENFTGKQGLIRRSMLGKRVNFSGRSVVVTGPDLDIDELGIPIQMAYELFRTHIIGRLRKKVGHYPTALGIYQAREERAYKALEEVIVGKRILMNRQPTLHKYGIQSFRIKLHGGKAIRVPPMVCMPYNMDFDGDQAALYVPLSRQSQREAGRLMSPTMNLLNDRDGEPQILPSHEMVLGIYYMTTIAREPISADPSQSHVYVRSLEDAEHLEAVGQIKVNTLIYHKRPGRQAEATCLGRLIIRSLFQTNQALPLVFNKRSIGEFISQAYNFMSYDRLTESLSKLQALSLKYATVDAMSLSFNDLRYDGRQAVFSSSLDKVAEINRNAATDRYEKVLREWDATFKELTDRFIADNPDNPIVIMLNTGARLSKTQFRQLIVGKGLMTNAANHIIEFPVNKSFADGLAPLEYWRTLSGSRKSLHDKKRATPIAGYTTGKLVNAARDLYVREHDCKTKDGILVDTVEAEGRYLVTGEYIEINSVAPDDTRQVRIRSPVTCKSRFGICETCYGINNGKRFDVKVGYNAGTVAAHSLTEPTTQMTLRTFHTSGAVSLKDSKFVITAARAGLVGIISGAHGHDVWSEGFRYMIHPSARLTVANNQAIEAGDPIAFYSAAEIENTDINGSLPKINAMLECNIPRSLKDTNITPVTIAPVAGMVTLSRPIGSSDIEVRIAGEYMTTVRDLPVYVADGSWIRVGQRITYGIPHLQRNFVKLGLEKTFYMFKYQLKELYEEAGAKIKSVHFETIYRCLTNMVIDSNGRLGLLSNDNTGERLLVGALQSTVQNPSWLKSMYRGWTTQNLLRAINSFAQSFDLPSERIASGELINKDFKSKR